MKLLQDGVVHRPETQLPYQKWNFFILWHSSNFSWVKSKYNDVFAKIDHLDNWDKVYVFFKGRKYTYELYQKKVVNPDEIWVYWYIPWRNLSIMTCWPIGSVKQRMIWLFRLVKQ
jgi:LPXTG-site transpeptidase (sortase) family protein